MFLRRDTEIDKHRNLLPHWQQGTAMQFVTFRLGDAMPAEKLRVWRERREIWQRANPPPWSTTQEQEYHRRFTARLEYWLDQGHGSCLLADAAVRTVMEEVLMKFQGSRVIHHSWVMMPNHVHLIFTPLQPIEELVGIWKSHSARKLGRGSIWQRNYRDTLIRDEEHFQNAVRYVRRNPRKLRAGTFTLWEGELAAAVK